MDEILTIDQIESALKSTGVPITDKKNGLRIPRIDVRAALDAAFMKNRDPLTHRDGNDAFRPLFKRILMTLPAPLGLGPVMEALDTSYKRT